MEKVVERDVIERKSGRVTSAMSNVNPGPTGLRAHLASRPCALHSTILMTMHATSLRLPLALDFQIRQVDLRSDGYAVWRGLLEHAAGEQS